MARSEYLDERITALMNGRQITNGAQAISYDSESQKGYLCCDTPMCCDMDFTSLEEIMAFIDSSWVIAMSWEEERAMYSTTKEKKDE